MTRIDRLLPEPATGLDDDALLAAYEAGPGWRANFVSSVDGAASHDGRSGPLSGEADKRVFGLLRRLADVIVVGAGTVRAEGYAGELVDASAAAWRTANGRAAHPALVIVSGSLDLDAESELFGQSPVRPLVMTVSAAAADRRAALTRVADVVDCGVTSLDAPALVALLAARGLTRVLCEGGPRLFASLLAAGVLDELCLTVTPALEAGEAPRIANGPVAVPREASLAHVLVSDSTLLLRYTLS